MLREPAQTTHRQLSPTKAPANAAENGSASGAENRSESTKGPAGGALAPLVLGALGVVFGDIGTSPIYALREAAIITHSTAEPVIMGVLSMVLWAVFIVVVLKYACFVMRADNEGEGGIVALTALVRSGFESAGQKVPRALLVAGLVGAAMFYGDSMVTPAISVLSAVEGISEVNSSFQPAVVPLAVAVLVALFWFQHRGSAVVGRTFGPIMALWFLSLGAVGIGHIVQHPQILRAFSPLWALRLAGEHPALAFGVLAAVILALTGAEALYADIGHFGKRAIRVATFAIVLPAIVLGYFGQAATILYEPGAASQPFFRSVPHWALIPAVGIAMLATIIASQAVISGAFSMTSQAVELGFLPRVRAVETSQARRGQVYVPSVNAGLLVAVLFLVLFFRSSERLTDAYGLAVACTMVTTSVLMFAVCRTVWHWSRLLTACVATPFLALDCLLLAANVPKIPTGGWFPVSVGVVLFVTMSTWRRGRELAAHHVSAGERLERFLRELCEREDAPARVPGTAVYPGSLPGMAPAALMSNVAHNHVLHKTVIVFANVSESAPRADENERIETHDLGNGCFEVVSHHGFTERPNLPRLLASLEGRLGGWRYDAAQTTFYLPRDEVAGSHGSHAGHRFSAWRQRLFAFMSYHSATSADYYGLAAERVVELGVQVVL